MAKTPKTYTRLTRNATGVGSYSCLWLAADHLMITHTTGYTESYSRLQLRDIQAIFLTQTDRRLWWGLWWGAVTLVSGVVAGVTYNNDDTPVASVIVFGIGLIMGIWNQAIGPGCRAYVCTGVQTVPLPSLVRRKKAARVLGRLQSLIVAAQADLSPVPPVLAPVPPASATVAPVPVEMDAPAVDLAAPGETSVGSSDRPADSTTT